jgi:acetyl-CoA carboxylase carboxyltransferase component
LNDSTCGIQEGVYSLGAYGELFWRNTQASGVIPQIASCWPMRRRLEFISRVDDFVVMTKDKSHMYHHRA